MKKLGIVLVLAAILIAAGIGIYTNKDRITNKITPYSALKLTISTNLSGNNTPTVNNLTFEQANVPFFYKRSDSIVDFPDVNAVIRLNSLQSEPISYWASSRRNDDEGIYTLTSVFRDGKEPKPGDMLIITLRLTNFRGNVEYKTTAFYDWQ